MTVDGNTTDLLVDLSDKILIQEKRRAKAVLSRASLDRHRSTSFAVPFNGCRHVLVPKVHNSPAVNLKEIVGLIKESFVRQAVEGTFCIKAAQAQWRPMDEPQIGAFVTSQA